MSGRLGKCVAGALVALAGMLVVSTASANAAVTLKNCRILAEAANRDFYEGASSHWGRDPVQGGCIAVAQKFINDSVGGTMVHPDPNVRKRVSGLDIGWYPLVVDGHFGTLANPAVSMTTRAVKTYRRMVDGGSSGKLTWRLLENMHDKCRAAEDRGYRTTAC